MADVVDVSNRWPLKKAPPPLVAVYVRACLGAETIWRQFRVTWGTAGEIEHDKTGRCNLIAIYRAGSIRGDNGKTVSQARASDPQNCTIM